MPTVAASVPKPTAAAPFLSIAWCGGSSGFRRFGRCPPFFLFAGFRATGTSIIPRGIETIPRGFSAEGFDRRGAFFFAFVLFAFFAILLTLGCGFSGFVALVLCRGGFRVAAVAAGFATVAMIAPRLIDALVLMSSLSRF